MTTTTHDNFSDYFGKQAKHFQDSSNFATGIIAGDTFYYVDTAKSKNCMTLFWSDVVKEDGSFEYSEDRMICSITLEDLLLLEYEGYIAVYSGLLSSLVEYSKATICLDCFYEKITVFWDGAEVVFRTEGNVCDPVEGHSLYEVVKKIKKYIV